MIRKGKDLENVLLEKAKNLINDYCKEEFGYGADFSNLEDIGLAFTTVTDYEIEIQVCADLKNYKIVRLLNSKVFDERVYESLEDLIYFELQDLDFDDLTYVSEEDLDLEDLQ